MKFGDKVKLVKCKPADAGLTEGEEYEVIQVSPMWNTGEYFFSIVSDIGTTIGCIYPECSFGKWELVK